MSYHFAIDDDFCVGFMIPFVFGLFVHIERKNAWSPLAMEIVVWFLHHRYFVLCSVSVSI